MLLFEHKQYLQSCGAESSMQTKISSFKILAVSCLQKRQVRDYNELLPGSVTSQTQINPAPGNSSKGGGAMLPCFREEEEKTRDARNNLFIWITILSSNDSDGFTSFKIIKAGVLNTVTLSPCSASLSLSLSLTHTHTHSLSLSLSHTHSLTLSLSLSLSHSDRQISSDKLFRFYTYFHTAMRSIINGHACGCCAVLKL